jgi:F0F1-type ATP synthase alpha subunit
MVQGNEKDLLREGVVTSVGCGVVQVSGFSDGFVGEQFTCTEGEKSTWGQVINLSRTFDDQVLIGGILVDPSFRVSEGSIVKGRDQLVGVIMADSAIGALLDPCGGYLLLGEGREVKAESAWLVEAPAPSIIQLKQFMNRFRLEFWLLIA